MDCFASLAMTAAGLFRPTNPAIDQRLLRTRSNRGEHRQILFSNDPLRLGRLAPAIPVGRFPVVHDEMVAHHIDLDEPQALDRTVTELLGIALPGATSSPRL